MLIEEAVLRQALELMMATGADFGDVFAERSSINGISSDDRKINTTTFSETGVGLRVVKQGKTFYGYTDSYEPENIFNTARVVADAARQGGVKQLITRIDLTRQSLAFCFPIEPDPAKIDIREKIERVHALTDKAWSCDPRVVQVSQLYREVLREVTLASSDGMVQYQKLGLTEFYSSTYLKEQDGNLQNGFDGRSVYAGEEFYQGEHAFAAIVDKSVQRAQNMLKAVDSPRGNIQVVLASGGPGVLFHESCGHGMEADLVFKGSNFKNKLGKQTAAKGVTLVDDGTNPQMPGSFVYDDEGTPSEKTILIDNGIQRNYLCDRTWAPKLGLKTTGNGRRQSFRYPPIPRMRNTYIAPGDVPGADIIKMTGRGIYVADAGGGQVDPVTGNFMMGVTEGYLIENGRVTRPIKGATISGMGIETLKSIDLVGDDLKIHPGPGRCGKIQMIPVGYGMPTIRVQGIMVGGGGEAWKVKRGGA